MQLVVYVLLAPLIVLWYAVALAGAVVGPPVVFVLKRVTGWDPPEANQDELFVALLSGAAVVAAAGAVGVWWLVSR